MTAFINILLTFTVLFNGLYSQIDFAINPQKYHAIDIVPSDLPNPVTEYKTDDYVQLSEVKMHYRVYGNGEKAIVLIHGNGGSINSLKEAAEYLANDYTVYLPESRCHGKSSDPGEISYKLMAKDYKEFIEAMALNKPIVIGHSDGGINAITLAAEYPNVPGAIISTGANSHPKTFKLYFPLGVAIKNIFKPDKLNDMMLTLPDFTPENLSQITCPSYIVGGEHDIMWISDTVYIAENIKGSDMAIVKGANHSTYMSQNGAKAYTFITDWLNSKNI